jgi:hypothetical protein
MVMPCSRSAARPSTSRAKSISSPCVPTRLLSAFQRGQLVFEDHLGIVEQPPDQGDLPSSTLPQVMKRSRRLVLVLLEIGVDILGDQGIGLEGGRRSAIRSNPPASSSPCWPPASLSMARPCRSLVVASSIS